MIDDDTNSPGRDASGRFVKGFTGNKRGRPPKKRRLEVPNQLARDFLEFGRQSITVPGPNGPREITKNELVIESVFAGAMKGRVGSQRLWIEFIMKGRTDLLERYPSLEIAEVMRQMYEDPMTDYGPGLRQAVDEWIRRIKRL